MNRSLYASSSSVLRKLALAGMCCLTASVVAQNLPDPTRPPASTLQRIGPISPSSRPVLQSILISPTRRLAIISGKQVMLGEKFGTATLIKINESSVVLRDGQTQLTLVLFDSADRAPQ